MPSKSRRSRRKQSFQGTQKKGKRISPVTVAQEQVLANRVTGHPCAESGPSAKCAHSTGGQSSPRCR